MGKEEKSQRVKRDVATFYRGKQNFKIFSVVSKSMEFMWVVLGLII